MIIRTEFCNGILFYFYIIFLTKLDLAMTGEITLRGVVLPVGGVKEKIIAAYRSGFKKVILPALNQKDIRDLPKHIKDAVDFILVSTIEDVVENSFDFTTDLVDKLDLSKL